MPHAGQPSASFWLKALSRELSASPGPPQRLAAQRGQLTCSMSTVLSTEACAITPLIEQVMHGALASHAISSECKCFYHSRGAPFNIQACCCTARQNPSLCMQSLSHEELSGRKGPHQHVVRRSAQPRGRLSGTVGRQPVITLQITCTISEEMTEFSLPATPCQQAMLQQSSA